MNKIINKWLKENALLSLLLCILSINFTVLILKDILILILTMLIILYITWNISYYREENDE